MLISWTAWYQNMKILLGVYCGIRRGFSLKIQK